MKRWWGIADDVFGTLCFLVVVKAIIDGRIPWYWVSVSCYFGAMVQRRFEALGVRE